MIREVEPESSGLVFLLRGWRAMTVVEKTERTIILISDMQIPKHAPKLVNKLIDFVHRFQPDVLVNVGDDIDSPETSWWEKGKAGEYAGTLQGALDKTHEVHSRFREALGDKPYHVSRSNHGDRTQRYISKYAAALAPLRCLRLEELLGYRDLGITYHIEPFYVAPGWVVAHGDEGGSSDIAGRTASNLALRWNVSVACGHTHSGGLIPTSKGFSGRLRALWGLECGHLMDAKQASYLDGGHGNWQTGFGLLRVRGDKVSPQYVPIQGETFSVDGEWF